MEADQVARKGTANRLAGFSLPDRLSTKGGSDAGAQSRQRKELRGQYRRTGNEAFVVRFAVFFAEGPVDCDLPYFFIANDLLGCSSPTCE